MFVECVQECYDAVKDSLGTIYRDLTCSAKHPLGEQIRSISCVVDNVLQGHIVYPMVTFVLL